MEGSRTLQPFPLFISSNLQGDFKYCVLLCSVTMMHKGAGIACWLEHWTRDQKVASLNPGRSGG